MGSLSHQPSSTLPSSHQAGDCVLTERKRCWILGGGANVRCRENTTKTRGFCRMDHDIIGKATQVKIGALGEVVLWEFDIWG